MKTRLQALAIVALFLTQYAICAAVSQPTGNRAVPPTGAKIVFDLYDDPDFHWVEVSYRIEDRWTTFEFGGVMRCRRVNDLWECSLPLRAPQSATDLRLRTCMTLGQKTICSEPSGVTSLVGKSRKGTKSWIV